MLFCRAYFVLYTLLHTICSLTRKPATPSFHCPSVGLYPFPTDCHKFYLCDVNLVPQERTCMNGTHAFDPQKKTCVDATCSDGKISINDSAFQCPDEGLFEAPDTCQFFYRCDKELKAKLWKCNNRIFDPIIRDCSFLSCTELTASGPVGKIQFLAMFKCTSPGYHPDPSDCRSYFFCDKFQNAYHSSCALNEYFDPKNLCVSGPCPHSATNSKTSVTTAEFKCREMGIFEDENDCTSYHVCLGNLTAERHTCLRGHFDVTSRQCSEGPGQCRNALKTVAAKILTSAATEISTSAKETSTAAKTEDATSTPAAKEISTSAKETSTAAKTEEATSTPAAKEISTSAKETSTAVKTEEATSTPAAKEISTSAPETSTAAKTEEATSTPAAKEISTSAKETSTAAKTEEATSTPAAKEISTSAPETSTAAKTEEATSTPAAKEISTSAPETSTAAKTEEATSTPAAKEISTSAPETSTAAKTEEATSTPAAKEISTSAPETSTAAKTEEATSTPAAKEISTSAPETSTAAKTEEATSTPAATTPTIGTSPNSDVTAGNGQRQLIPADSSKSPPQTVQTKTPNTTTWTTTITHSTKIPITTTTYQGLQSTITPRKKQQTTPHTVTNGFSAPAILTVTPMSENIPESNPAQTSQNTSVSNTKTTSERLETKSATIWTLPATPKAIYPLTNTSPCKTQRRKRCPYLPARPSSKTSYPRLPEESFKCPGLGKYPNPTDRRSYFVCSDTMIPLRKQCFFFHVYDPVIRSCKFWL